MQWAEEHVEIILSLKHVVTETTKNTKEREKRHVAAVQKASITMKEYAVMERKWIDWAYSRP